MFKKIILAIGITVIIGLLANTVALAFRAKPTWETAFDPGQVWVDPIYDIAAVEQFRGNLYVAVSDEHDEIDTFRSPAVQIFRSADGKHWQSASDLGLGLGSTTDNCWTDTYGDGATPWTTYYNESWDMAVFKDRLYVGIKDDCYERPGMVMRSSDGETWEKAFSVDDLRLKWSEDDGPYNYAQVHKFGEFKGMMYVNVARFDPDIQFLATTILRSSSGNPGSWEKVIDLPGNSPGSFHVFKGALYMASDGVLAQPDWSPAPDQIWRSFDGKLWEQVVNDGFGNSGTDGLGGFADYNGYLYVGEGAPDDGGGQVWRSLDGVNWENVITNGLGVPGDEKFDGLVVYDNQLYTYSVNWTQGGTMYCSKDGLHWKPVNEPGWGDPGNVTTHLESAQAVFKNQLYLGIYGEQGGLLHMLSR